VVLADGTRLPADVVVCNADARVLYGALLSGRRRRVPPADSLSGFVMLLGLRGATAGLAEHTVFFGASAYDDEFDAIFGRRPIPVPDPVVYAHAPADVTSAPPGHEALYLLVNAPRHAPGGGRAALDWTAARLADDYADQVLGRLAARGCDVRDRVVFREVRTPADLERSTLAPGGAIYGRVQHGALSTLRRPANRSRVRGLFLVGGSTHPGGGLPLVAMSARIVADAVGDG
jgi:phytoene dehydrogenase-like protein